MVYYIIILLILAATHAAAFLLWQRFTRREVALNAADITANGSADDLRKGYHQRRGWARFWPWLGLVVGGSLAACLSGWLPFLTSFLSLGILLAGFFARYFTPWLNVAMKLDYKPEFYASPDSASWPDAAVWKQVRATSQPGIYDRQPIANDLLKHLLTRAWLLARLLYAAGMLAALLLFVLHY